MVSSLRYTFYYNVHCPIGHPPGLYNHGASSQQSTHSVVSPYKGEKLWFLSRTEFVVFPLGEKLWPLSIMGKDLERLWSWL